MSSNSMILKKRRGNPRILIKKNIHRSIQKQVRLGSRGCVMVGRRLISTNSTTRCCDYRCPEVILPDFPRAGITMEIGRSRETRRSILLLAVIYIFERSCFRSIRCGFHGFHGPVSTSP